MLLEYPCAMQRKNHYWRREGDLYNYVIAVAIVFFSFTSIVFAAPTFENSLPTHSNEIVEYFSEINGCYYNFQRYEEGDRIVTNEPCLNCTCHNRMLMCYLRVCPFTKAIGQDCTIEKKPDQCCPIITCPEVPVKLLTSSTTSPAPITSTTEIGFRDNYGCTINNLFYADGAQVPSDVNKPCELCYCIRNRTACVMQECTLNVEGCKPIFKPGVCCPVRYECDYDREYTSTGRPQTTGGLLKSTTSSPVVDCQYGNKYFSDGELIKMENPCEHCYCMRGEIVCAVQNCGEPLQGKDCIATTPPPNTCCPSSYACANETATIPSDITGTTLVPSDNTFAPYDTTTYLLKNTPTVLTKDQIYNKLGETKSPTTTSLPEKIFTTISNLFSEHPSEDIKLTSDSVDANEHSSPMPPVSSSETPQGDSAVTETSDEDKTTAGVVVDDVTPGVSLPKASQGISISSTQYETTTGAPIKEAEDNATKEGFTKSPIDETSDNAGSATEITTERIKLETIKFNEKYDTTKSPEKEPLNETSTTPNSPVTGVNDDNNDIAPTEITTEQVIDDITTPNFLFSKFPSSSEKPADESSSESKFQSTTRQFDINGVPKDPETTKAPEESLQATTKVHTDNTEPPSQAEPQTENLNTLSPESTASLLENITKIISSVQNNNKIPPYQIPPAETTKAPIAIDTTIAGEEIAPGTEKVAGISSSTTTEEPGTVVPSVIPGEGSCLVDGITYPNTSIIESYNPCHSRCICLSSIPTCTLITCAPPPSDPNCMPIQMKPETCCPAYICNNEQPPAQVPTSHSQIMPDQPEPNVPSGDETTIVNSYELITKASDYPKSTPETITEKSKPEIDVGTKPPSDVGENHPQNDAAGHQTENDGGDPPSHGDGTDTEPEPDDVEPKPTFESDPTESKPENELDEHKPTPANDLPENKPEPTTIANDKLPNEQTNEGQKVPEDVTELNIKSSSVPSETAKPEIVTTEKQFSIDTSENPATEIISPVEPTTVKQSPIVEEFNTEIDNLAKPTTVKAVEEKFGGSSETPTTSPSVTPEHTEKPAQQDGNPADQPEDEILPTTVSNQDQIVTEIPPDTKPAPAVTHSESELPHTSPETTEIEKIITTEGNSVVQPIAVSTESNDEDPKHPTEITPTEAGVTINDKIDVNLTSDNNPTTLTNENIEPVPTTLPSKVPNEQNDGIPETNAPISTEGTLEHTQTPEVLGTTEVPAVTDSQSATPGAYSSSPSSGDIGTEVPNETTKLPEGYSSTQPGELAEDKHPEHDSAATTIKDNNDNPFVETTTPAQIINDKITTDGESTNVPDVTSSNPANDFASESSSSEPTVEKETESNVVTDKASHSSEPPTPDTFNLQTTTVESETSVPDTTEPVTIGESQQSSSPSYGSETTSHYVDAEKHSETTSHSVDPEQNTGSGLVVTDEPSLPDVTTISPTNSEGIKDNNESKDPITVLPETSDSPAVTVLPSKVFPTLPPNSPNEGNPTELPEDHLTTASGHDVPEPVHPNGDETTPSHDNQEPVHQQGEEETSQKIGSPATEHPAEPFVPETASQEATIPPATKKPVSEPDHTPQYVETSSVSQTPIQHSTWTRKPFDEEITSEPNYYPPMPIYPTGGGDGGIEGPNEEPEYEEGGNFGTGTCRYAGKIYVSAQQIPREDPCDFCFCFRSDIICLQQSCPPPIQGCRQETISGFCCPRYECPVASALTYNASTTTTTTTTSTTTTAQPHFTLESYRSHARKVGCMIHGYFYKVGEDIAIASGPCLECICGSDGRMKCDPKSCSPEPFVRSFIGEAMSKR